MSESATTRITLRVDTEVLEWFRSLVSETGGNYQTEINRALRTHVRAEAGALDSRVREIVREELDQRGAKGRRRVRA